MATALVLMVSSRVGREINHQSAWTVGIEVLVIVAIPAVVWWSDLLYRSVVVVWTLGVGLWFLGTFAYYWWPLVMVPFAWIGFVRPRSVGVAKGFGIVLCGVATSMALIAGTALLVAPSEVTFRAGYTVEAQRPATVMASTPTGTLFEREVSLPWRSEPFDIDRDGSYELSVMTTDGLLPIGEEGLVGVLYCEIDARSGGVVLVRSRTAMRHDLPSRR